MRAPRRLPVEPAARRVDISGAPLPRAALLPAPMPKLAGRFLRIDITVFEPASRCLRIGRPMTRQYSPFITFEYDMNRHVVIDIIVIG